VGRGAGDLLYFSCSPVKEDYQWLNALTAVISLSLGSLQLNLIGCLRKSGNAKLLGSFLRSIISLRKKENANTMRNDQSLW